MDQPLITKYRPAAFDEMLGNETQVNALRRALASDTRPHAYLFTGPSGIGKTTTARIIGRELAADIIEIDAASNSGVDATRAIVELSQHMPMTGSGKRLIIIDECHALSKPAWQALLKLLEEPPTHLFLALCTTEEQKVPETVKTRAYPIRFAPLKPAEIEDLLLAVIDVEKWEVHGDVLQAVVVAATGQPRKALTMLQAVHDASSRDEVRRILSLLDESEPIIEICQILLRTSEPKAAWPKIRNALSRIDDGDFEEGATLAGRYIAAALQRSEKAEEAERAYRILAALTFPASTWDKKVAFLAAIGRTIWE